MDTAAAILLLSELPGVGEKTLAMALRRCAVTGSTLGGSADGSFADLDLPEAAAKAAQRITAEMRQAAERTARALRASNIEIITIHDVAYPTRLSERLPSPPPVVYSYGNLRILSYPTAAVANSNSASERSLAQTDAAAEKMCQEGWTLVTGHNRPAYQRAALCALRFGGKICYVLDRGLLEAFGGDLRRELFPAAHVWSSRYDPETTLTISPFTLRAHGIGAHNRRRDELVFALADTILVGEITAGGQMERRVREALEIGTQVRLVGPESACDEGLLLAGAIRV